MRTDPSRRGLAPLLLAILLAAGCGAKASRENDRLRREILALEARVDGLAEANAQLEARLRALDAGAAERPDVLEATPQVTAIAIDRRSHARDEDGDGVPDLLVLYIHPTDGLGRFVQMVGDLSAHAAVLPADAESITIGRATLGPKELREAYRSSFMGTHYTVAVPITLDGLDEPECVAQVAYVDGHSGLQHTARRGITLHR